MSTKRTASRQGRTTSTDGVRSGLQPEEEKVLRMRYGLVLPDDQPLPQKGEGRPDVQAKLLEIERRAFEMSGRLAQMRAEAGLDDEEEAPEASPSKKKIIDKLKAKRGGGSDKKAAVTASAKAKPKSGKKH